MTTDVRPDDSGEISLADIIDFFSESWKTLLAFAVAGLVAGAGLGFAMPSRYEVTGYLQPAKALDKIVEPVAVLAEKMRVSTFYGDATRETCFPGKTDLSEAAIIKGIVAKLPRQASLVTVSYKGRTPEQGTECLMAVLEDVRRDQAKLARPMVAEGQASLRALKIKLAALEVEREQLMSSNRERLASLKGRLAAAEKFVTDFSETAMKFDFRDPQFGAYALLLTTFVSKQTEIKELAPEIKQLEMQIASGTTPLDNQIGDVRREIDVLQTLLGEPQTEPASYAVRLVVPRTPTDPNRPLIAVIGLLGGGMAGLGFKLISRYRKTLRPAA
jgi:uncharacterized protein involved in exopolysaccharide biosynthesis